MRSPTLVAGCLLLALGAHAAPAQKEVSVLAALTGRTATVTARLAPNKARAPSVGVIEEVPSGTGDQWLATLWQAVFVATQATGTSPLDFEFTLRVGGPLDGASAGVLTAATLTALLKNKKVLPGSTLVGAMNPDGSVGPVGDVVARLRAAASAGIKRFGFPVGTRQQADASGEVADLLVEGRKLGVEVKEVGSLDDAYTFLTGDTLARAAAVTDAEMELWPAELTALTKLSTQVRGEFQAELPKLDEALTGLDPKLATSWRGVIERSTRSADDFAKNGDTVRALVVWTAALTTLRVAQQDAELVKRLVANERDAVFAVLDAHQQAIPLERQALREKIATQFPNTTRANDVYAMDILESAVTQGLALQAEAKSKELQDEADALKFQRAARGYAEDLLRLREELRNGERYVALYASLPALKKSRKPIDAAGLANWYVSAGAASLAALKSRAKDSAFEKDALWLELLGYGDLLATETDARARLVVSAREATWAAYLVNTWDSLGGQLDAKGNLTVRNARALSAQLDLARQRVFQSCGQAKQELGSIPFPARMRFLNARAAREGSDQQKTGALADLWIASWWCEFAVRDKK